MGECGDILVTYCLWLTFGLFGVHHIYLGRDRHAFVWFWTGGGFVLGWLWELWRIPDYVRDSHDEMRRTRAARGLPPFRIKRFVGEVLFSSLLGLLVISALPEEFVEEHELLSTGIRSIAVAIGVHTVANIGKEECKFVYCLIGAFLHFPALILGSLSALFSANTWCAIMSAVASSTVGRRARPRAQVRRNIFLRLLILLSCGALIISLIISAVYFNGNVVVNGRVEKVKVVVDRFFASPKWPLFKNETKRLLWILFTEGFANFTRELHSTIDPKGQQRAYKVLDVVWNANYTVVRDQYRKLVKIFHPDRLVKNSTEERKAAEAKFIEVQKSYERISGKRQNGNNNRVKTEL